MTPTPSRPRSSSSRPKTSDQQEIPLRITLVAPPSDVMFCLQRGRDELVSQQRSTGAPLSFDFTVRVKAAGDQPMNFLGPFTQGPPASRFVYVNSGTMAGESETPWTRRAKIPLAGITAAMVRKALTAPGARIEARIQGTARDGGPACATCRPIGGGWSLISI
jgi:hypothetical protein